MKKALFGIFALALVAFAPTADSANQVDVANLSVRFRVKVKAELTRQQRPGSTAPTVEPIVFEGEGRAVATRRGVGLRFDTLEAVDGPGKAKVGWHNPLRYRPEAPHFVGRGATKIRLPNNTILLRLLTKGTIMRTDAGDLVIHGRFSSGNTRPGQAKFTGRFVGQEVDGS